MPSARLFACAFSVCVGLASITGSVRAQEDSALLVFAAASLSNVLEEIGERYESDSGNKVVFSFAGSMTLARQIEASSGVDVFISADVDTMDYLDQRGLIQSQTRDDLLQNELVLVAPLDSETQLTIAPGFALADALGGGRLAVANPISVPAGRYAHTALAHFGVWESVASALAEGEDVRAALAMVARGEAPLGIVYATDAMAESRVRIVGRFPQSSHPPVLYPAALTAEAAPGAENFLDYLRGERAQALFESAGFSSF